jgi:CCR4-NOT transcription complex subunit 7/8
VERTKLIQVGFTLADPLGNLPARAATWQFHLEFDLQRESIVPESIQMLKKAGIDFERLRTNGIPHRRFAEALFASGTPLYS